MTTTDSEFKYFVLRLYLLQREKGLPQEDAFKLAVAEVQFVLQKLGAYPPSPEDS